MFKIKLGKRIIDFDSPVAMAIVNVTPDSFFPESRSQTESQLENKFREAIGQGASIIDIGGYSSRPGAADVPAEEELSRVHKAISVLRSIDSDIPVSVDTFRSYIVRRVYDRYGAFIVNDISAGDLDPEMIPLAGELNLPYIAMHMRSTPDTMLEFTDYENITEEVIRHLQTKTELLRQNGVEDIILDPGFGFAKTTEQNYELMHGLDRICSLGYPVLSGVSRKSMIYKMLGNSPEEALTGTTALNWESLRKGASILRVHDVEQAMEVIKLYKFYMSTK